MAHVLKNPGVQRARVYASFGPVWVATHGVDLDLDLEFEFNLKLNYPPDPSRCLCPFIKLNDAE